MKKESEIPQIMERLLGAFTKEQIASRLQVSVKSVERWRDDKNEPRQKEEKHLRRLLSQLTPEAELKRQLALLNRAIAFRKKQTKVQRIPLLKSIPNGGQKQ